MKKSFSKILAALAAVCFLVSCTIENGREYRKTHAQSVVLLKVEQSAIASAVNHLGTAYMVDAWRQATGEERERLAWENFTHIFEGDGYVMVNHNEEWIPGEKRFGEKGSVWTCSGEGFRLELECMGNDVWRIWKLYDLGSVRYELDFNLSMIDDLRTIDLSSGTVLYQETESLDKVHIVTAEFLDPVRYSIYLPLPGDYHLPCQGRMGFTYSEWEDEKSYFEVTFGIDYYWIRWAGIEEKWSLFNYYRYE